MGPGREIIAARGEILSAGGVDSHLHVICPQQAEYAIATGITTIIGVGAVPNGVVRRQPGVRVLGRWPHGSRMDCTREPLPPEAKPYAARVRPPVAHSRSALHDRRAATHPAAAWLPTRTPISWIRIRNVGMHYQGVIENAAQCMTQAGLENSFSHLFARTDHLLILHSIRCIYPHDGTADVDR